MEQIALWLAGVCLGAAGGVAWGRDRGYLEGWSAASEAALNYIEGRGLYRWQ